MMASPCRGGEEMVSLANTAATGPWVWVVGLSVLLISGVTIRFAYEGLVKPGFVLWYGQQENGEGLLRVSWGEVKPLLRALTYENEILLIQYNDMIPRVTAAMHELRLTSLVGSNFDEIYTLYGGLRAYKTQLDELALKSGNSFMQVRGFEAKGLKDADIDEVANVLQNITTDSVTVLNFIHGRLLELEFHLRNLDLTFEPIPWDAFSGFLG